MIYIAMFTATTCLLWLSGKCKGILEMLLVLMGLLLPCLLAGFRDETVGVDVLSYAKWMCIDAQNMGFVDFMTAESGIAAPGWNVFTWLSVRLLGGLPGYLFAIEALCIAPVYFALRRVNRSGVWAGVLIWLCLEYAFSLNGMRQCAAMGFVFLAVTFIPESRAWSFLILVCFGMMLHQTAVIGILLYPLAKAVIYSKAIKRFLGQYKGIWLSAAGLVAYVLVFVFGDQMVIALSSLKDSYGYQVEHLGERDWSLAGLYLSVSSLIIWFVSRRDFVDIWSTKQGEMRGEGGQGYIGDRASSAEDIRLMNKSMFVFLCVAIVLGSLLWQLNYIAATLGRIGYYGTMLMPLLGGGSFSSRNSLERTPTMLGSPLDYILRFDDARSGLVWGISLYVNDSRNRLICPPASRIGCSRRSKEHEQSYCTPALAGAC